MCSSDLGSSVLLTGIALGLLLGLLAGGRLEHLAAIRLRRLGILFAAVVVRFGTEALIQRDLLPEPTLRVPLLAIGSLGLVAALWANRRLTGIPVALAGKAFASLVAGGEAFKQRIKGLNMDQTVKDTILTLFRDEQMKAQDRDVQDRIKDLTK